MSGSSGEVPQGGGKPRGQRVTLDARADYDGKPRLGQGALAFDPISTRYLDTAGR
jgi:hypothetical protein